MAKGSRQRKLFTIDTAVLQALDAHARECGAALNDLFDEALRDLLKKRGQPGSLKEALVQSARRMAANDPAPRALKQRSPTKKRGRT